jgi:hypothetical protein
MLQQPYNPLDRIHLGESVVSALLACPIAALPPPEPFIGAGIYALYYSGDFPAYRRIAEQNAHDAWSKPIYVGQAVPVGARRGSYGLGESPGEVLYRRLHEHAASIQQAINLSLSDFACRYLVVDDIWIPLAESLLISRFIPLWNYSFDGFGNHDPGAGHDNQQRSAWDDIHPGRLWAARLRPNPRSQADILQRIVEFLG